jgi:hypothetical protein
MEDQRVGASKSVALRIQRLCTVWISTWRLRQIQEKVAIGCSMRLFNFSPCGFWYEATFKILIEPGLLGCGYIFRTLKPAEDVPDRELNRELKEEPERNLL